MFDSVLVANRGEIAVRIMRACEELGIGTVAVYSEADKHSGHVRYADTAYNIGPARAAESYLDQEAIIDVAKRADADAIHPGYGFLAENAEFAARVEETEGLVWVGPSSESMRKLGEKTAARQIMQTADVPIVPGTTEPVSDPETVQEFGTENGYPVAIKAEGGGGGRGMKIATGPEEVQEQLESAKREGEAYFDNDSVYLERYLENPRHIEVQIVADHHGNVRHLGERDCSLQRRHQKVIEEGPSPALTDELRETIGEAARRGVREAGYTNAGTVEFLVEDENRNEDGLLGADTNFYFLEVNTRIQVEHCVTEEITGLDIVKWQLRVAQDEELDFTQEEVDIDGHAMEFRINAENAAEDFAPATGGVVERYDTPGGIGIRLDDGLTAGDELVTDYDSMLAKLIVHGSDRDEVIERGKRALAEYEIDGVVTIIPFHRLMLHDDVFVDGTHTTKYLDEEIEQSRLADAQERWGSESVPAGEEKERTEREIVIELDGERFEVKIEDIADFGTPQPSTSQSSGATAGGTGSETGQPAVSGDGEVVRAEMQGTILELAVSEGDVVSQGDVVCVLEAMKMENDILATNGGTVSEIPVEEGQSVNEGDPLIVFE